MENLIYLPIGEDRAKPIGYTSLEFQLGLSQSVAFISYPTRGPSMTRYKMRNLLLMDQPKTIR